MEKRKFLLINILFLGFSWSFLSEAHPNSQSEEGLKTFYEGFSFDKAWNLIDDWNKSKRISDTEKQNAHEALACLKSSVIRSSVSLSGFQKAYRVGVVFFVLCATVSPIIFCFIQAQRPELQKKPVLAAALAIGMMGIGLSYNVWTTSGELFCPLFDLHLEPVANGLYRVRISFCTTKQAQFAHHNHNS